MYDKVKQRIHKIDKHASDYVITCNRAIPYVVIVFKNINLNSNLFYEFYTTFYNEIFISLNISSEYL